MLKKTPSERVFNVFNGVFMLVMVVLCLAPMVHILALSLSSSAAISAKQVTFLPAQFTLAAYRYCLEKPEFLRSILVSLLRLLLGVPVNMLLVIFAAYPLSKDSNKLRFRTAYAWFFVITMLCSAGMVPTYMVVYKTGLMNSIWSLILPGAVPVFSVVLLLNFFRSLPKELEESALIDGAGHMTILWRIYVPLSITAIATVFLFSFVFHWNSWFDGIIYMNRSINYPLQSYLQTLVIRTDLSSVSMNQAVADYRLLSNSNLRAAQVLLGTLPILLIYPFLQRYFVQGMTIGSVKG